MKKSNRIFFYAIIFSMALAFFPTVETKASANYNADAALKYAKENWDKNKDQLCAEFVMRCVKAGGLNVTIEKGTGPAYREIGKVVGINIGTNANDLANLPRLTLDANGNASKTANGNILQAGDVVIQWCFTHHIAPHMLICGGYNSSGNATFYAHNASLNNVTYNLGKNLAYQHTANCNMGGKVIQLSARTSNTTNSTTSTNNTTKPAGTTQVPVTSVSINTSNICINSGDTLNLSATVYPSNATNKTVTWKSGNTNIATVSSNGVVTGKAAGNVIITATAGGKSATSNIEIVARNNISQTAPTVNTLNVTNITQTNAVINGSVTKKNGQNIGNSGFYFGTSSSNMKKAVSFPASQGANAKGGGTGFDIWCDMNAEAVMTLKAGTTYYYQCFVVFNGTEYRGAIRNFTTSSAPKETAPTVNTLNVTNITQTNAVINGSVIKKNGQNIGDCGFYFGTGSSDMKKAVTFKTNQAANAKGGGTGFDIWCDMNAEARMTLKAGTTYYYQCFVVLNGTEYRGTIKSFTTSYASNSAPKETAPTVNTLNVTNITQTNAVINGSVIKKNGQNIGDCGFYFGTGSSDMKKAVTFKANQAANAKGGGTGFDIWCNMNTEAGMTLKAKTTYYYQCFVVLNGTEYRGVTRSFTTK